MQFVVIIGRGLNGNKFFVLWPPLNYFLPPPPASPRSSLLGRFVSPHLRLCTHTHTGALHELNLVNGIFVFRKCSFNGQVHPHGSQMNEIDAAEAPDWQWSIRKVINIQMRRWPKMAAPSFFGGVTLKPGVFHLVTRGRRLGRRPSNGFPRENWSSFFPRSKTKEIFLFFLKKKCNQILRLEYLNLFFFKMKPAESGSAWRPRNTLCVSRRSSSNAAVKSRPNSSDRPT